MNRSLQEIIELLVFGLIALIIGTGLLWLVGWVIGLVGALFTIIAGFLWFLLKYIIPIAVIAAAVYALIKVSQNRNEQAEKSQRSQTPPTTNAASTSSSATQAAPSTPPAAATVPPPVPPTATTDSGDDTADPEADKARVAAWDETPAHSETEPKLRNEIPDDADTSLEDTAVDDSSLTDTDKDDTSSPDITEEDTSLTDTDEDDKRT